MTCCAPGGRVHRDDAFANHDVISVSCYIFCRMETVKWDSAEDDGAARSVDQNGVDARGAGVAAEAANASGARRLRAEFPVGIPLSSVRVLTIPARRKVHVDPKGRRFQFCSLRPPRTFCHTCADGRVAYRPHDGQKPYTTCCG